MCEAVERHAALSKPTKNGSTLYDQFEQVERSTGRWPEGYEPLPPPEGTEHIWQVFWELRSTAQTGFSGPCHISFIEIDAWERVRGIRLEPFVLDLILQMDSAYLRVYYSKKNEGVKPAKRGQQRRPIRR